VKLKLENGEEKFQVVYFIVLLENAVITAKSR